MGIDAAVEQADKVMGSKQEKFVVVRDENLQESGFRVFSPIEHYPREPARQDPPPPYAAQETVTILTCGEHSIDQDGGGGAWLQDGDVRNLSLRVEENMASRNSGEISVIMGMARLIPKHHTLNFVTKAKALIQDLTVDLQKWDCIGWLEHEDAGMMKPLVAALRQRSASTYFTRWNSSIPTAHKDAARLLANHGMSKEKADNISVAIQQEFNFDGLRLDHGTQRLFYKGIQQHQAPTRRKRATRINLSITKYAVHSITGVTPTDPQVWKSLRNHGIPRGIRNFLWKVLHDGYKIGDYWQQMQNYENRGKCHLCGELESMEHILLECEKSIATTTIWRLTEQLWKKRDPTWPTISFGAIMGSQLIEFKNDTKKKIEGKTRLFRILTTEASHLIWKLRCERAIKLEGKEELFHSDIEIHNRWVACINKRLKYDRLLADSVRYGKKALKLDLVLKTWSGVLMDEHNLPDDWIRQSGVLVGIAPRRPPGRNR
ncbi:hypothetical protein BU15DRAFT_68624 [Melanogaster broomeanus]|nr:hypothetical protein BU15DRAFT_68624 [Melanogaster broomeanus]